MIQQAAVKTTLRRFVAAVEDGDEKPIRELFGADATWPLHAGRGYEARLSSSR